MKSKRIVDIETRVLPDGGATCSMNVNFETPDESAKTAAVKVMFALNEFCKLRKVGIVVVPHDAVTLKPLKITLTD